MTISSNHSRRSSDPRVALLASQREAARDVASYIADISGELQEMASGAGLPLLAHFLAMARLEAEMQASLAAPGE